MRKGLWSPDEDERLSKCIAKYMGGSWSDIAKKAGLDRCGKSCRRRWMNHLRPDLKRGRFTPAEVRRVVELHQKLGNRWSEIASHLVGRTDNDVKNLWNTQIKRHLKHFHKNNSDHEEPETEAAAAAGDAVTKALDIDKLVQAITAASNSPTPTTSAAESGPTTSLATSSTSSDADTKSANGDVGHPSSAVSQPLKRVFSFPLFPHAFTSSDSSSTPLLNDNNNNYNYNYNYYNHINPSGKLLAPSRSISEASNMNNYTNNNNNNNTSSPQYSLLNFHNHYNNGNNINDNKNIDNDYKIPSASSCSSLQNLPFTSTTADQQNSADFNIFDLMANSAVKLNSTGSYVNGSFQYIQDQNSINSSMISEISLPNITSACSPSNDQDSSISSINTNVTQSDSNNINNITTNNINHNNNYNNSDVVVHSFGDDNDQQKINIVGSDMIQDNINDDWMALWSSCLQDQQQAASDFIISSSSSSQDCWSLDTNPHIL